MRDLLAARGPDYRPNDTNLEDRFQELARRRTRSWNGSGTCSTWANGSDGSTSSTKGARLVIEVDSALYHDAVVDRSADAARRAALEAAGYRVHSFTDHEIFHDRAGTLHRLRAIRSGA